MSKTIHMTVADLRQIHGDTLAALTENKRKHDDQRARILELLGDALKTVREMVGITASEIADDAGISVDSVIRFEAGELMPPGVVLESYIKALAGGAKSSVGPTPEVLTHFPIVTIRSYASETDCRRQAACGQSGVPKRYGSVNEVTCPQCRNTPIFIHTKKAIDESR